MIFYFRNILILILVAGCFYSCNKESGIQDSSGIKLMKVYEDEGVEAMVDMIPGDGVLLIVYRNENDVYRFKLVNNNGEEIWNKDFNLIYSTVSSPYMILSNVIHEENQVFTLFYSTGLIRINYNGDVVFNDPEFTGLNDTYRIYNASLNTAGNYLVCGSANISGSRAFFAEIDREGGYIFRKFYFVNVNGQNVFSDVVQNADGSYTVGGSFVSYAPNSNQVAFLVTYDSEGNQIKSKTISPFQNINLEGALTDNFDNLGKKLYYVGNGRYIYVMNVLYGINGKFPSLILLADTSGAILNARRMDLNTFNLCGCTGTEFCKGIVKNPNGGYTCVINSSIENQIILNIIPMNYTKPQYSYLVDFDEAGNITNTYFPDRNYANQFTSICILSDGRKAIGGISQSFGNTFKLTLLIEGK
ncbi:MAG: hypothetical protein R2850_12485 [Bacteroidia bacterium]